MIKIKLTLYTPLCYYLLRKFEGGLSRMLIQVVFGHVISGTPKTDRGIMPPGLV